MVTEAFAARPLRSLTGTTMPTSNTSKKRLRQNIAHRARNRSTRSSLRSQLRKVREAVTDGDFDKAEAEFRLACKKLDQAGSKGILHRNTTARYKSRLSAHIKTARRAAK